jgi:hypothetical protein
MKVRLERHVACIHVRVQTMGSKRALGQVPTDNEHTLLHYQVFGSVLKRVPFSPTYSIPQGS